VAGMVAKTNTPILISDVDKDGRFLKVESAVDIGSPVMSSHMFR